MGDVISEAICMVADPSLDQIHIRDLNLRCVVGIYPDERREKQDVGINITMWADLRLAGKTDRIEDTVDYKGVKKRIVTMVETSSFFLIERLAQAVAELCLEDNRIKRVSVTIDKPGALRFARSVAVQIFRSREDGPDNGLPHA